MTLLSDLITPKTTDEVMSDFLSALQTVGFPTSSWHSTSVPRRLLYAMAETYASFTQLLRSATMGGLNEYASGDWLTLFSSDVYQNDRYDATFCEGHGAIADTASAGPYTITAGQLTFTTAAGRNFSNKDAVTLALDGTERFTLRAEFAGDSHNVPLDAITELLTPLPGVGYAAHTPVLDAGTSPPTVTVSGTPAASDYKFRIEITLGGALGTAEFQWRSSPTGGWTGPVVTGAGPIALGATGVSVSFAIGTYSTDNVYDWASGCTSFNPGYNGVWLTSGGTDEESDELLRQRNRDKWSTLGYGQNDDWYRYYARNGHAYADEIVRVKVQTCAPHTDVSLTGTSPLIDITNEPATQEMFEFDLEITTGGGVGTAVFRWRYNGGAWNSGVLTAAFVTLGGTGIIVGFPGGTYVSSDTYWWVSCFGGIVVTLAGASGAVGATALAATDSWLQGKLGNALTLLTRDADTAVQDITATCYIPSSLSTTYEGLAETALQELVDSLDIGGTLYDGGIIGALVAAGAEDVDVAVPSGDVAAPANAVMTLGTVTLTLVTL